LIRLAGELARRRDVFASSIMFILADPRGRIGGALRATIGLRMIGPIVLPSRVEELATWAESLARYGPVWDFQGKVVGIVVIVENDAIAVTTIDSR
jgi:hypothetical protein